MKNTKTLLGSKAIAVILKGVNSIYEPVRRTLGPYGKNALLYGSFGREPRITNDGYTVAECQEPKDEFIRLAAHSFRESCKKTNERVGDGTTATVVIAGKLYNLCYNLLADSHSLITESGGISPITLKKQILETVENIKEKIKSKAKKIKSLKELEKIAIISVENEKIGKIIAKMAWDVGIDGFIDVVEGYKGVIETELNKGMRFPAKIASKGFVNRRERFEMVAEDAAVIITNYKLDNVQQLAAALNPLLTKNPKIVIFAPDFGNDVIANLYAATYKVVSNDGVNNVVTKNKYDTLPVKVPSLRTEQLEDLAIYCGAKLIDKEKGHKLSSITVDDLGFLEKLIVKDTESREDAVVTGGAGTKFEKQINEENKAGFDENNKEEKKENNKKTQIVERIEILKGQLTETKQENFKKLLERRIASMGSAIGVIRVGDITRASSYYQKLKIEDAVYACKAALRGGYIRGGGLELKELVDELSDNNICKIAFQEPYNLIQASNEGGVPITDDIIDPMEVIYYAIEHAGNVVANLITADSITAEADDPVYEEGNFAIARMIGELVISDKIAKGQLKASEAEAYRDMWHGYSEDEIKMLDDMGRDFNEG